MIGRGFKEAPASYTSGADSAVIGQVRRFGPSGPAYEVVDLRRTGEVAIRVVETGECLDYGLTEFLADPIAEAVP